MAELSFINVFGLVTLQDGGRPGLRHRGIPLGGYADRGSARLANALVGEYADAPVVEFAQAAAQIHFSEALDWAWSGAPAELTVDGCPFEPNRRHHALAGAVFSVCGPYRGRFGYLALGATIAASRRDGSVSPLQLGMQWSPAENVLGTGTTLHVTSRGQQPIRRAFAPIAAEELRSFTLYRGPEYARFARWVAGHPSLLARGLPRLSDMRWEVLADSNRVGLRLGHPDGPRLARLFAGASIRSSPTIPGTVQVTPDGQLIVALADGPTMGGYPRLGWVAQEELGALAQETSSVRFRLR